MATVQNRTDGKVTGRATSDVISATDVLKALGSLKLTVGLFAASLIIVLVGTLAQDELNMQDVKERYFVSWIAWMRLDDFLPQAFYPHANPIRGVIPFPGGALIGALLMVNLLASKTTRFSVSASGGRLMAGVMFIVAGFVVAGLIIASGHSADGLQGAPPISYDALWHVLQGLGVLSAIGLIAASINVSQRTLRIMGFVGAGVLVGVVLYTLVSDARIGEPGLRIVWQLAKGTGAGLILLVGCLMIFGRQGGNLLLHFGVGLLMVGQFTFGDRQLEQRISLVEGESTNALINLDKVELAFITETDEEDTVVAVPGSTLQAAAESGELIKDDALPVDVKVLEFFPNSDLVDIKPGNKDTNQATKGVGLEVLAVGRRKHGGTDGQVNVASAYVDLRDKDSGESVGVHLVSQMLSDRQTLLPGGAGKDILDEVEVGESQYQLGLKYHREIKPYWVHLEDVQRRNYSGTETPRDYSSYIRIIDTETGEDLRERVWMNNPLRYRGETFFQSSYTPLPGGKELTGLQVVRNSGWLIPYVACSIMALGMLAHFTGTLKRFVGRREREREKEVAAMSEEVRRAMTSSYAGTMASVATAVFAIILLMPWSAVMTSMSPQSRNQGFDMYTAGKIPTQFGGRMLPLDAFARQALKAISNSESLSMEDAPKALKSRVEGRSMSAIQWLMEVAIDDPALRYMQMFRVDAEEVRSQLKLVRRESRLYSLDELLAEWPKADALIRVARDKDEADLSFKERKLLELDRRTRQYMLTAETFQLPAPQQLPTENLPPGITEEMVRRFEINELKRRMESIQSMPSARIIPPSEDVASQSVGDPDWTAFAPAFFTDASKGPVADDSSLPSDPFSRMLNAYKSEKKDYEGFNQAVDDQIALSAAYPIGGLSSSKVGLERWMQSNAPHIRSMIFYVLALVLGLVFLATGDHRLRNATWGVLLVAFLVHSVALVSRIYITGRAPVINIYSSAVFIGWAAVLGGLVIDRIFRLGFGNLLAATAGALTLLVANGLSSGDTMPVLQAVLDTQFWLATHVLSVSLGYVATLVAGFLGIGYLAANWLGASDGGKRSIYRMIYGSACFGILFSTIGTILGGLWPDDSWGRFWGWDPKENGALMIVLWNALILHARWDKMVGQRGFAALAVIGNVMTAWSWFGTNQLGIGLHSYGFTSGALITLIVFVVAHILFVVAALMTTASMASRKAGSA